MHFMTLEDKIGREEIVEKVCLLVDSLSKDSHMCIAINGAWGSGKSFVLNMIEERLSKKRNTSSSNMILGRTLFIQIRS